MTEFVLDNSVAMRWLLASNKASDQWYAESVLKSLAKAYRLSSYDAAYLELALREGLPLATLDKNLLKAARRSDIELYLK